MRNLRFPSGSDEGRRPRNDDFVALQELVFASEKIYKQLGQPFVVEGCEVTGTSPSNDISAGIVFLDGKLRTFEGITGIDLSVSHYLISGSDILLSSRPLFTGGTFEALVDKKVVLSATPSGSGENLEIGEGKPASMFKNLIYGDPEWQDLMLTSVGTVHPVGLVNTIQFKKDVMGRVVFKGQATWDSASVGSFNWLNDFVLAAQIPAGYLPLNAFAISSDGFKRPYYITLNPSAPEQISIRGTMFSEDAQAGHVTLSFVSYMATE